MAYWAGNAEGRAGVLADPIRRAIAHADVIMAVEGSLTLKIAGHDRVVLEAKQDGLPRQVLAARGARDEGALSCGSAHRCAMRHRIGARPPRAMGVPQPGVRDWLRRNGKKELEAKAQAGQKSELLIQG